MDLLLHINLVLCVVSFWWLEDTPEAEPPLAVVLVSKGAADGDWAECGACDYGEAAVPGFRDEAIDGIEVDKGPSVPGMSFCTQGFEQTLEATVRPGVNPNLAPGAMCDVCSGTPKRAACFTNRPKNCCSETEPRWPVGAWSDARCSKKSGIVDQRLQFMCRFHVKCSRWRSLNI